MSKYFLMFLTAALLVTASTVVLRKSAIKTDADATHAARQTHQAAKPTLAHMSFGFKRGASVATPATYRWAGRTVTYRITDKSAYYRQIWRAAVRHWNAAKVVKLVPAQTGQTANITMSAKNDTTKQYGNVIGLTFTSYHANQSLGSLHVLANARSYLYKNVARAMRYSQLERERVAEHELGHALGLGHAASKRSVMYYASRGIAISSGDVKGLRQAYFE